MLRGVKGFYATAAKFVTLHDQTVAIRPIFVSFGSVRLAHAQDSWQADWDHTLKAAEQEGQVVYSGCGSHDYLERISEEVFPRSNSISVAAFLHPAGIAHHGRAARRQISRRRGALRSDLGPYVLSRQGASARSTQSFILPEVKDPSKWWQNKHHYSDPEGKYLLVPAASVYERFASYHTALASPGDFKSFADHFASQVERQDRRHRSQDSAKGATARAFCTIIPTSDRQYLRRLLSEMDITYSRDYRQATDWLAQKTFRTLSLQPIRRHAERQEPGTAGPHPRHRQLEGKQPDWTPSAALMV